MKGMKCFMEQFLKYESLVFGNMDMNETIRQMIPDDAFIVDERKIPLLLDGLVIEHAKQMGYAEDKIYIIREIKESFMTNGKPYLEYEHGSLCDESADAFIERYEKMGIYPYWSVKNKGKRMKKVDG